MVQLKDSGQAARGNRADNFNTTMVQLKGAFAFALISWSFLNFNTTMVQLKVRLFPSSPPFFLYFNTTMVQLKDPAVSVNNVKKTPFQYHYGSIKRTILKSSALPGLGFQ